VSAQPDLNRREFLKISSIAGAGFMISVYLQGCRAPETQTPGPTAQLPEPQVPTITPDPLASFEPNVFLTIDGSGEATITVHKPEVGQGIRTALAMIAAEELDIAWTSVHVEQAVADRVYGNQVTGGSGGVSGSYRSLRRAGALARAMLVAAAAEKWGVEAQSCRTEGGMVIHESSDRSFSYADLVEAAAAIEDPDVEYKDPQDYTIIGTRVGRVDNPAIVVGSATYGSDIVLPDMRYAAIARCPVFGGGIADYDATQALAMEGVEQVIEISNGIAVVAENSWAALQGQQALEITWDEGRRADPSTDSIRQKLMDQLPSYGGTDDPNILSAIYEVPLLAHATAEPMNCIADVREESCEIWAPTQVPYEARQRASRMTRLPLDAVTVHIPLIGGGFGRRLQVDYVEEAVEVSMAIGAPAKVVWSREDDIQHDFYHPFSVHLARSRLDSPSLPQVHSETYGNIQTGAWRAVTNVPEAFVRECFLDEMALARGRDPYELRLELHPPAFRPVLELVASRADWGSALPTSWGRGIACHATWGVSPVAQVAEVSVSDAGAVRVHRVVCAVDCGLVINPGMVEEQMEGGIAFGLTAVLKNAIIIENKRVQQSNFHDYPLLRMDEMPQIEVYIVPSDREPSGVGEMGGPPIAPAVLNAVFAATGKRIRRLPIRKEDFLDHE
jgi:CO/xanthine dehydrogenase Mo-binding subunit